MTRTAKTFFLCALFAAGCPDQIGLQCPPKTASLGDFALYRKGEHPAGECSALQADGGPVPLAPPDDAGTLSATFCFGAGSDGGPQLQLRIAGRSAFSSDLLADGGFHFAGSSPPVNGTACGPTCAIGIDEVFEGYLLTSPPDAGFAVQPDGGLPIVTGLTGTIVDNLTTPSSTGCLCALPCQMTLSVSGTRF
ncbi:MAG: hypothetical protein ABR567_21300 [Myxococcales bacterium]|nr:hypothetical protein [Myxococcales bacterium]